MNGINFQCFVLGNNSISDELIPRELFDEVIPETMLSYWKSLKESSVSWKKLKIMILGHGEIGKTTLLSAIHATQFEHSKNLNVMTSISPTRLLALQNEFLKNEVPLISSTETAETKRWNLKDPLNHGKLNNQDEEVFMNVLDFGGQPEYSLSHRNFLSTKQCVYWVAFDTSSNFQIVSGAHQDLLLVLQTASQKWN